MSVLAELLSRSARYSARVPQPSSLIAGDLGIDREDFIEFCLGIERAFRLDLRSLFEADGSYRDADIATLAAYVEANQNSY